MAVIKSNAKKYSIRAMCEYLGISKSLVYYQAKVKVNDGFLDNLIIKIFKESKEIYGSRKIKAVLQREGLLVSRRKIREIMSKYCLESKYTLKQYKKGSSSCNNEEVPNIVNQQFHSRKLLEVIVSDLTYVRVADRWAYVCLIVDLYNREIVGHSCGYHKNAKLVEEAFENISYDLNCVEIFHSDRGSEFISNIIKEFLVKYDITRSLSKKGNPYDNAVAEATYRIFKTEFCYSKSFRTLEALKLELSDYINWYNRFRIHGSLYYLSPIEYKSAHSDLV